jgi:hypothetical protein
MKEPIINPDKIEFIVSWITFVALMMAVHLLSKWVLVDMLAVLPKR